MRRLILALPISLMALWGSQAMAVDFADGFRIGINGGVSDNKDFCAQTGGAKQCDATDFTWKIYGGFQLMKWFALEGGYADLGKAERTGPGGTFGDISSAETQALALSAVFTAPVLQTAGFYIKVGGAYWDQDRLVVTTGLQPVQSNETGGSFLAGAGFRFPLNDRLGMVLEYEQYFDVGTMATGESDIGAISAGLFWSLGGRKE
jgi:OOP family OmpA-OmpF porin